MAPEFAVITLKIGGSGTGRKVVLDLPLFFAVDCLWLMIIVASHSEAKGKFGVEGFLPSVVAQSSWGAGRVSCPALSRQQIGKSNNINAVNISCHGCPDRDARLLQACSCLLAAVCSCSGIAEGKLIVDP